MLIARNFAQADKADLEFSHSERTATMPS
jgi:hypothetical protein